MTQAHKEYMISMYGTSCFKVLAKIIASKPTLKGYKLKLDANGNGQLRNPDEGEFVIASDGWYTYQAGDWFDDDPRPILEEVSVPSKPSLYPWLYNTYKVHCIKDAVKKFNANGLNQLYKLKHNADGTYAVADISKVSPGVIWLNSPAMLAASNKPILGTLKQHNRLVLEHK